MSTRDFNLYAKRAIVFLGIFLLVFSIVFLVSYYQMLQHYLLCPFTCGGGCLCLSVQRTHLAGVRVLWRQVTLIFRLEGILNMLLLVLVSLGITLNLWFLGLIYLKERAVYKANSMVTVVLGAVGALFGGCLSCNLALIYPLLSALGLSGVLALLPWQGKEIMLVTGIILIINSVYLYKRYKTGLMGRMRA